jgi:hypothetical protein
MLTIEKIPIMLHIWFSKDIENIISRCTNIYKLSGSFLTFHLFILDKLELEFSVSMWFVWNVMIKAAVIPRKPKPEAKNNP